MMKIELYRCLRERYLLMARGSDLEDRILGMLNAVLENCDTWPDDKTGRFIGYVQCLLIEVLGVTTIEIDRNFTRPLFHAMYESDGITIPDSCSLR